MNLSFRNRIAIYYMIATALLMALVFGVVYFLVFQRVYKNLDNDLALEAEKHTYEVRYVNEEIEFIDLEHLEEHEHREIQVNPVFIQLVNLEGEILNKSPNLKDGALHFRNIEAKKFFDTFLNKRAIRQVQWPIIFEEKTQGYILAAMSAESAISILKTLRWVLFLSYLAVLLSLYFVSRYLAGRSIKPVQYMTKTIGKITKNSLNERVSLPENKDELYQLSLSFNALLERIENALHREKQFTSDASHELRTPLAVLKGTLEVLIRKPRNQEEYESKIGFCLSEIDRMSTITEQLLLLARIDGSAIENEKQIDLANLVNEILERKKSVLEKRNIVVEVQNTLQTRFLVSEFYSELILGNILSNAIKYSNENSRIKIALNVENDKVSCSIQDFGIGIKSADLDQIFNNFYRSESLKHKEIAGTGLGLSIAKKAADAIGAKIEIESELGKGSVFRVWF